MKKIDKTLSPRRNNGIVSKHNRIKHSRYIRATIILHSMQNCGERLDGILRKVPVCNRCSLPA